MIQHIVTKINVHIKFYLFDNLYSSIASILSLAGKTVKGEANATTTVIPYRHTKTAIGIDPSSFAYGARKMFYSLKILL